MSINAEKERWEISDAWHNKPASRKQLWAIHCILRINTMGSSITRKQASDLLSMANDREMKNYKTKPGVRACPVHSKVYLKELLASWEQEISLDKRRKSLAF